MEDWTSLCNDKDTEAIVLSKMREIGLSAHLKYAVQSKIKDQNVQISDLEETVHASVNTPELQTLLKNAVYKEVISLQNKVGIDGSELRPLCKEPLDFVRVAEEEWEATLRQGINTLAIEKNLPLCKERSPSESEQLRRKWNSIGSNFPGLHEMNPIYSPKDFLEVLTRVRNSNYNPGVDCGGLMKLNVNVKSLTQLRMLFSSLHPSNLQMENSLSRNGGVEYNEKAEKVLQHELCPLARELCKGGCPVGLRRELWGRALTLNTSSPEDVKKIAANDDNFFVFEDNMHQVLLCFLHDNTMLPHFDHLSVTPMKAFKTGHSGDPHYQTVYPPSGIIPFHGFSIFLAPLCFMFDRADRLYALFREMYLRYFVHLHCISSHPQGILGLCCQFEHLLQCKQPELTEHLRKIGAEPLRMAFDWLMTAFAGHLETRQLLLLWDRIIGYNTLSLLPVMAVSVFEFRATNLFKATTLTEAETVLSDLRCLNILPLLQQTLFM
ncbi:TBC1 domain family member 19-like isoform X2 [Halichondria panicea]|uniref:TBC1 domain family member 19-like isoform X2 n=1 Tax=Halichondria panicea TaxID=6063 RepID=UPI00312B32C9